MVSASVVFRMFGLRGLKGLKSKAARANVPMNDKKK
jgi:hypothetical protein